MWERYPRMLVTSPSPCTTANEIVYIARYYAENETYLVELDPRWRTTSCSSISFNLLFGALAELQNGRRGLRAQCADRTW